MIVIVTSIPHGSRTLHKPLAPSELRARQLHRRLRFAAHPREHGPSEAFGGPLCHCREGERQEEREREREAEGGERTERKRESEKNREREEGERDREKDRAGENKRPK